MDHLIIILTVFVLLFFVTRTTTTVLHELGHAIPALLFTGKKVSIYIGSYGDEKKSISIHLHDKLNIYFIPNPFKWRKGMIKHMSSGRFYKEFIILILGPTMSLFLAIGALWVTFSFGDNGFLKLLSIIFFCSAIFDLRNIYPITTPITLSDGSTTYNDGYQIAKLLKFNKESRRLFEAIKLYEDKNYAEAVIIFEQLHEKFITPNTLALTTYAYVQLRQYAKAKEFYSRFIFQRSFILDTYGLCQIGHNESNLNQNDLAIEYYNRALELDSTNVYALYNKAYTFSLLGEYDKALAEFEYILTIDPLFTYAYSGRAFVNIKLQLFDSVLSDIDTAINCDDKNPYAYANLGLYHFETGEYHKAMEQLILAFEIDPNTHMINDYIKMASIKLNELV